MPEANSIGPGRSNLKNLADRWKWKKKNVRTNKHDGSEVKGFTKDNSKQ